MCSILIVDDEPGVLRMLGLLLRQSGCQVTMVPTAEAALAVLDSLHPDLVLTDVRLPGMDGVELAHRIRSSRDMRETTVLLMSAYGRPPRTEEDEFLPKPFDLDRLLGIVDEYRSAAHSTAS